jgi:hypothetical protein
MNFDAAPSGIDLSSQFAVLSSQFAVRGSHPRVAPLGCILTPVGGYARQFVERWEVRHRFFFVFQHSRK